MAVSGTAATFLTTTFIFRIIFNISVSRLSLIISFFTSILGAIIYYLESQGLNSLFSSTFSSGHKYKTLLLINIIILIISFSSALFIKKN